MLLVDRRARRALLALPFLVVPASLQASGFALEGQGARATGFSGAYVAQTTEPSVMSYNPAGIAFLKGRRICVGGLFDRVTTDFTAEGKKLPAGTVESASGDLGAIPAAYVSQPLGDRAVLGIGFDMPFGFRSRWNDAEAFTGRFLSLDARVRAWSIQPTLAYKVADRFAVGVGVDVLLSTFEQVRRLGPSPNPFPAPTDVAELRLVSATTSGIGVNAGVLASPSETVSFGLAYRSSVAIAHPTQAAFLQILTGNKPVDDAVALSLPASQTATANFSYPARLSGGIALKRGGWVFEGDLAWTFWSSFDAVTLSFPETPAYDSSLSLPQAFVNTWRAAVAAEFQVDGAWEVRGSYSYDHSPQPVDTLSPLLHDEGRHGLALGGSYVHENLRVDTVARMLLSGGRSTGGLSRYDYDGSYQSKSFGLGVSLGYRF